MTINGTGIVNMQAGQFGPGQGMDGLLGAAANTGSLGNSDSAGFSEAGMTALISAAGSMKLARVQGSVAAEMKGRAGVLKAEIKQDAGRGKSVEKKQEELAAVEQKAQAAELSQLSSLADANKAVQEAAKADNRTDNKDNKDTDIKKKDAKENVSGADTGKENESGVESVGMQSENSASEGIQTAGSAEAPQLAAYTPVDIRL